MTARDLDHFSAVQPSLAKEVRLPCPGETSILSWPPADFNFAVQASNMVAAAMASRGALYSADWAEVRKLDGQRKLAEWAKRNEILERQQAEAKQEFYKVQRLQQRGE